MAEQFHQHLAHLSWWEQIDRLFNPSKYSCSVSFFNDDVVHVFWLTLFVALGLLVVVFFLNKKSVKKVD